MKLYRKVRTEQSDRFIVNVLDDHWGQRKGAQNSKGSTKVINTPNFSKKLAEAVGIMLGDGSVYVNKNYGIYQVRIAGNIVNEKPYLIKFIKPLFEKLFGISGRIIRKPQFGTVYIAFDSRELVDFLMQIGVYTSLRKSRNGIPKWIKLNKGFLVPCLRGLIDTDGSVHRLSNKDPQLIRISFKNSNKVLLEDVKQSFSILAFHPSKIITRQVFLTRKADIKRFAKLIGFSNAKNKERLDKLSPIV